MLFNSIAYAIFLPVVFISYWLIPSKNRWILLLIASYSFYMSWNYKYVVLILFTTAISYSAGLLLERYNNKTTKNVIVAVTLILCLGVLFVFKYYDFALGSLSQLIGFEPQYLNLLLPVGISFYTFQTLSYVIDVYRGNTRAERHFGIYATFVSFFPQLVAGPIERSSNLLPQINTKHYFSADNTYYGIRLIAWGLFKKIVVADNLAIYVDKVFGDIYNYKGGSIVIATIFFAIQIYCDFSGYSDIARGSAKLFGINLMDNFKSPYFATSVKDFWSRWHISLSGWFRDYLYIPMGGNRVSKIRWCFNIMFTFLVSGLWHGASWHFVVWGGCHGVAQIFEKLLKLDKVKRGGVFIVIRRIVVFVFVAFAWIFFRADNMVQSIYAITSMFDGITNPISYMIDGARAVGFSRYSIIYTALYIIPLVIFDYISLKCDVLQWVGKHNVIVRHGFIIAIIAMVLAFGYIGQSTFVYFQF